MGVQKTGWAPYSIALVSYMLYNQGKTRLNMLPAYIIDGILVALVYKGLINSEGFKFWVVNTLLLQYNCFPTKQLVVIIDNARFYYLERIQALFNAFSVKLIYLPIYLPNLNPIKEFFRKLKAFIQREQSSQVEYPKSFNYSFKAFLLQSIDKVSSKSKNVRGHF